MKTFLFIVLVPNPSEIIEKSYAANPVAADLKFEDKPIAVRWAISDRRKIGNATTLTVNCRGLTYGILLNRD